MPKRPSNTMRSSSIQTSGTITTRLLAVMVATLLPLLSSADNTMLDQPFGDSYSALSHAPCVSLFHRQGRLGCGTQDRSVDKGRLVYFDGSLPSNNDDGNYVSVVEDYDLTDETMALLVAAKNRGGSLQGVLVLNSTIVDSSLSSSSNSGNTVYSPDSQTPQGYGTPSEDLSYGYNAYPWNSQGQNLFAKDLWGIAMAFVADSDAAESLRQGALQGINNSNDNGGDATADRNVVAEFNYYMGPADMTSADCLAWKDVDGTWNPKCLPLGGASVWATAGSPPYPKQYKNAANNNNNSKRPVFLLSAGMDSTSMFHDISPGANTAASNILVLMMAAKLLGANVDDAALDALPNRIAFALFQGESYGFVGSRSFFNDVVGGFACNQSPVLSSHLSNAPQLEYGCLEPMRPSVRFADLGQIAGTLSVDQVGHAVADGILYVHADQDNDNMGSWLVNLLSYSSTSDFSVAVSSAAASDDGYPYPPSPLTSLLQITGGGIGGAILTGFDYAYTSKAPYHSHMDSARQFNIELDTIAAAATIMARTALAVAYDDGSYSGNADYDTPTAYAKSLIPELDENDETLVALADCLFQNGSCDLIRKYSAVEVANERARTGVAQQAEALGTPPSYHVGVYSYAYGQPFVFVDGNAYGAYNGDKYGESNSDTMVMSPPQLEGALRGMLNDFLGRGSKSSSSGERTLTTCKQQSDCANVNYCQEYSDYAVCTGNQVCVCQRSHYHIALDEALQPVSNKATGYFKIDENDSGSTPIYTEPYWSPNVGIRVYRDVGVWPGMIVLATGLVVGATSVFGAILLKVGLKKQKLY